MKILKEPFLHFIIIGALLFAFYMAFDEDAREPGEYEVVVPPGRIEQLSAIFQKTWQRPPTRDELQGLIDDFIMEEIYYREAKAAGLDQNDTLIRRRLRQKMEFLTDDLSSRDAEDTELIEFMESNPERFRNPARYSFVQIFFNPDKLGEGLDAKINAASESLKNGQTPEGHATLLPPHMSEVSPQQITGNFGEEFAKAVSELPIGEWSGPITSSFGIHFVKVDERLDSELPELDQIRNQVIREWDHDQRKSFRDKFDRALLEKYEVTVEWPATDNPEG